MRTVYSFYPNLQYALKDLGEDECLHIRFRFILEIVYKYNKKSNKYRPTRVENPIIYPKYDYFIFRKEVIENFIETLTSATENNKGLFQDPLREAISLGLKELDIKDKEFICVRSNSPTDITPPMIGVIYSDHLLNKSDDEINKPILMSLKEEEWKELFLEGLRSLKGKVLEELEIGVGRVLEYIIYGDHDIHRWVDIIVVSNKELEKGKGEKGRALAKFWENERVLGVDKIVNGHFLSNWDSKSKSELKSLLEDNTKKLGLGPNKFTKILLSGISLQLSGFPDPEKMEVILVPLEIKDDEDWNSGEKKVRFLVLRKLKIGDIVFSWRPISVDYDHNTNSLELDSGNGRHEEMEQVKVVDREKIPVELSKEKGKAILIDTKLTESITVLNRAVYRFERETEKVEYNTNMKDSKYVRVSLEDLENPLVEEYEEIEKTKVLNEEMIIKTRLEGEVKRVNKKRDPGCNEEAYRHIRHDLKSLEKKLYEHERENKNIEERNGNRVAKIVLKRLIELLDNEKKIERIECTLENTHGDGVYGAVTNYYQHKIYPNRSFEDYESFIEATKDLSTPEIARRAKKAIELLEIEKERKLCFKVDGVKKKIDTHEEMEEILKDPSILYIKNLSGTLSKMLENHRIRRNLKKVPKELEGINKLSVALSGIVASAIGRFPNDRRFTNDNEINDITEYIYELLFKSMTGGEFEYEYDDIRDKFVGWRKIKDTPLVWKTLIRDMVGLRITVRMTEKTEITVIDNLLAGPNIVVNVKRKMNMIRGREGTKWVEGPWAVYLDSGHEGKLIEITTIGRWDYKDDDDLR